MKIRNRPTTLVDLGCVAFVLHALFISQEALGKEGELEGLFSEARQATGDDYLRLRDSIVARGQGAVAFLKRERESSSWQTRLLAGILIERITHGVHIDDAISAGIDNPRRRETPDQIFAGGKALTVAFKGAPMALAEFLWKTNELKDIRGRTRSGKTYCPLRDERFAKAYAARALGLLGERRATHILLHLIETSEERNTKLFAGEAVGHIGDPSAFDDLLRIVQTTEDNIATGAAWNAIGSCLDESSLPKLEAAAAATEDKRMRLFLRNLAAGLREAYPQHKASSREPAAGIRTNSPDNGPAVAAGPQESEASRASEGAGGAFLAVGLAAGVALGAAGAWLLLRKRPGVERGAFRGRHSGDGYRNDP